MKTIIISLVTVIIILACNQSDNKETNTDPVVTDLMTNTSDTNSIPPTFIEAVDTSTSVSDIWVLEGVNGKPLDSTEFNQGTPYFDINTSENKINGHTGCNGVTGTITVSDDKIKFSQLITTKMACPKMNFEKLIQKSLSGKSVAYTVKEGRLELKPNQQTSIVLRRIRRS